MGSHIPGRKEHDRNLLEKSAISEKTIQHSHARDLSPPHLGNLLTEGNNVVPNEKRFEGIDSVPVILPDCWEKLYTPKAATLQQTNALS